MSSWRALYTGFSVDANELSDRRCLFESRGSTPGPPSWHDRRPAESPRSPLPVTGPLVRRRLGAHPRFSAERLWVRIAISPILLGKFRHQNGNCGQTRFALTLFEWGK